MNHMIEGWSIKLKQKYHTFRIVSKSYEKMVDSGAKPIPITPERLIHCLYLIK